MPDDRDAWSRSLLSPSPPPSDFSDTEELALDGAFISLAAESDLARELDLSRREDRAIVTKTPFTLATLRAKKSGPGQTRSKSEESNRVGNIKTAEELVNPKAQSEKVAAAKPGPKRNAWKNNTGWADSTGEAIPQGRPNKGKKAAESTAKGKGKGKKEKATAVGESTSVANVSKPKGKAASDKVQFRRLPADLAPTSEFPIVAGFERQKALPRKAPKPPPPKTKPPPKQTTLKFSSRSQADVTALVVGLNGGAAKLRPSARQPIRVYSSSSDGSSSSTHSFSKVLAALHSDHDDGIATSSTLPRTPTYSTHDIATTLPRTQQTPPLTQSDSTPSPEELAPVADPVTPAPRFRQGPAPHKPSDVALLEAMAEKGDMGPKSTSIFGQLMPARQETSYGRETLVFLTDIEDRRSYYASAALPPPSQVTSYVTVRSPELPASSASQASHPPHHPMELSPGVIRPEPRSFQTVPRMLPVVPQTPFDLDYRGPQTPSRLPSRPDERHHPAPLQTPLFPETRSMRGPSQSSPYSSVNRQKRPRSSWQSTLEGPPSPAEGDWGTLPNKKSRLTLRPSISTAPKASGPFHMPLFNRQPEKPMAPRRPAHPTAAAPADLHTQLAKRTQVTVWAPSNLRPLEQYSAPPLAQSYVPSPLKALQQAPAYDDHRGPQIWNPTVQTRSEPSRALTLDPPRPPPQEEDWTAAWGQSANRASRQVSK